MSLSSLDCEKTTVFECVKAVFDFSKPNIEIKDNSRFLFLVRDTSMDGMVYLALKNHGLLPELTVSLKQGYDANIESDRVLANVLKQLKKTPVEKTLIKDAPLKFFSDYVPGTRYSCDLDFVIAEQDLFFADAVLAQQGFLSCGVEFQNELFEINNKKMNYSNFTAFTFEINHNLPAYLTYLNEIKKAIKNVKFFQLANKKDFFIINGLRAKFSDPFMLIKQLKIAKRKKRRALKEKNPARLDFPELSVYNQAINRVNKIIEHHSKVKSFNYTHLSAGYVDMHFKLFNSPAPFNLNFNELPRIKLGENLFAVKNEAGIIMDACHFTSNLKKYDQRNEFHGFLKYISDLKFRSRKKIDWDLVTTLAEKALACPQTWFYLTLANKFLGCKVPQKTIETLESNSSKFQLALLSRINPMKLLFNEPDFFVKLYSFIFLKRNFIAYFFNKNR
ncbi:MAG: hypothetical protein COV47_01730 [Candidatus Diapherotrites archaeon CG11_big_fil_rev_8_21_14_0_20_37_9]|nr:MAG: hypothetical protein COV47_01730 [Candidatus Diapherotrites archaeon CG11_big_fil_rev_8_21_14_0_20_37_9]